MAGLQQQMLNEDDLVSIDTAIDYCSSRYFVSGLIENHGACFLVGNTQAGKSTAYSYLTGVPLTVQNPDDDIQNAYLTGNIIIGTGGSSKTLIPNVSNEVKIGAHKTVLVDLPGFLDTREGPSALIAAYTTKRVLAAAKDKKFIVTVPSGHMVTDAGAPLSKAIQNTKRFIPNINLKLKDFSVVLITRSFLKKDAADAGKIITNQANGHYFKDWRDDQICYLPAAGIVSEVTGTSYEPTIARYRNGERMEVREWIFGAVARSQSLNVKSHDIDFYEMLSEDVRSSLQAWTANKLLVHWSDAYLATKEQWLRDKKDILSYTNFCDGCQARVCDEVKENTRDKELAKVRVVKFVSSRVFEQALQISRQLFQSDHKDSDWLAEVIKARSEFVETSSKISTNYDIATAVVGAAAFGSAGGYVYVTGSIIGATFLGTVALPIAAGAVLFGGAAYLGGMWKATAENQAIFGILHSKKKSN